MTLVPAFNDVWNNMVGRGIRRYEAFERAANEALAQPIPGLIDLDEDLATALEGRFGDQVKGTLIPAQRARASAFVGRESIREFMDLMIRQMAVSPQVNFSLARGGSIGGFDGAFEAVYDYMAANNLTIQEPGDIYDTAPVFTGVGDGEFLRLTVDENGFNLIGWDPPANLYLRCEGDARNGINPGNETFSVRTGTGPVDNLEEVGPAGDTALRARAAGATPLAALSSATSILNNSGFEQTQHTSGTISAIPSWLMDGTPGDFTGLTAVVDPAKLWAPDRPSLAGTTIGIGMSGGRTLYQDFVQASGGSLNRNLPYLYDVAVYNDGCTAGTLTIRISPIVGAGGISVPLTMGGGGLAAGSAQRLRIPLGVNLWPKNWNANDVKIQITDAGAVGGEIVVDDAIVAPLTRLGARGDQRTGRGAMGQYWGIVRGRTAFVAGDEAYFSDTRGPRAINHRWATIAGRIGYFPSSATPTFADP